MLRRESQPTRPGGIPGSARTSDVIGRNCNNKSSFPDMTAARVELEDEYVRLITWKSFSRHIKGRKVHACYSRKL